MEKTIGELNDTIVTLNSELNLKSNEINELKEKSLQDVSL